MNYKQDYIYDIETYPNCFTLALVSEDGEIERSYEVSDFQDDREAMFKFLDYCINNDITMYGFNNLGFDDPVMHDMLFKRKDNELPKKPGEFAQMMFKFAQNQIDSGKGGFPRTLKDDERLFKGVDIYKIHHFDNKAKTASLKLIEFNMRSETIEDLPYPIGMILDKEECKVLREYNMHDTKKTREFIMLSKSMIDFRKELSIKYNRDFMNHNDTKIGKDYFCMLLEEHGVELWTVDEKGKRKKTRSNRPVIKLEECLFDYYDFKRPEFIAVVEWFKKQRIRETKGVFSDIDESDLGDVAKYANMHVKRVKYKGNPKIADDPPKDIDRERFFRDHPLGWIEPEVLKGKIGGQNKISYYYCWREAAGLNVVVNGFQFDFGTGGIHGSISEKVARAVGDWIIVDADVASMYPNLGISNRVYPEHLTEKFCDIYESLYQQRKSYPKGSAENAMLKLALNGVYGDSNNQFGHFYDPMYTMKITVNGQLSLCLLAEKLMDIPDMRIIQVNTDGITVAIRKQYKEQYDAICKAWQEQVKLELEFAEYSKMIIRDVNAYIAVYTNGKIKRKGPYQYEGLGWHQNQGGLVIPMAAEAYMLHGTPLDEFVRNHKNPYDFCMRTKVPRSSKLFLIDYTFDEDGKVVLDENSEPVLSFEEQQQNVCRYYPSPGGKFFRKVMPPVAGKVEDRNIGIENGYRCKVVNNMKDFDWDIDYEYYIKEAEKLVIE